MIKSNKAITLIALIITIIVLLILAGVTINMVLGENGLFGKAKTSAEVYKKQATIEKIEIKIAKTNVQSYEETRTGATLQYLADSLCEDDEIEYVLKQSKSIASLPKIDVDGVNSIFTKLKSDPYEFEIGNNLKVLTIDGVPVGDGKDTKSLGTVDYGRKVNFKSIGTDDEGNNLEDILTWRLFYVDNNYVYLISSIETIENVDGEDKVKINPIKNLNVYDEVYKNGEYVEKYRSGSVSELGKSLNKMLYDKNGLNPTSNGGIANLNIIYTAYMCDTSSDGPWAKYTDGSDKVWGMAGPTVELFARSYNSVYGEKITYSVDDENPLGYYIDVEFPITENSLIKDGNEGIYNQDITASIAYCLSSPGNYLDSNSWGTGSNTTTGRIMSSFYIFSYGRGNEWPIRPIVIIDKSYFEGKYNIL